MATVPEIHVVHVPVRDEDAQLDAISSIQAWAPVEVPRGQRPTPIVLAVLGVLTGIGAMALGGVAVFSASTSSSNETPAAVASSVSPAGPAVEERALSLLAKPSTARVAFRGSGGRLVLAVGTGGRAVILLRGFDRAPARKPYFAWVIAPGGSAARAARFSGNERAVFLTRAVGPQASVVVSTVKPVAGQPGRSGLVAQRP